MITLLFSASLPHTPSHRPFHFTLPSFSSLSLLLHPTALFAFSSLIWLFPYFPVRHYLGPAVESASDYRSPTLLSRVFSVIPLLVRPSFWTVHPSVCAPALRIVRRPAWCFATIRRRGFVVPFPCVVFRRRISPRSHIPILLLPSRFTLTSPPVSSHTARHTACRACRSSCAGSRLSVPRELRSPRAAPSQSRFLPLRVVAVGRYRFCRRCHWFCLVFLSLLTAVTLFHLIIIFPELLA